MDPMTSLALPLTADFRDILFFILILARVSGMFIMSPFWSNSNLKGMTRTAMMLFMTALMAMALYGEYRGPDAQYEIMDLPDGKSWVIILLIIMIAKEAAVGYILGFCFSLVFEALMVAGQLVGVMIGLSIAEIIDPISGISQSIVTQLFTLCISLLMITMDLHHVVIQTLAASFNILPIGYSELHQEMMQDVIHGSARLFPYGLRYAAIPYVVLFLVTVALGFMARIMPEMNIFMVGFPLKIFIGYYGLIAAIGFFPLIFREAFVEYQNMATKLLTHLQPVSP
jgi:flagellar biosynthetic protein FliR